MPDSRAQKNKTRGKVKSALHKGGKLGKRANSASTLRKFH